MKSLLVFLSALSILAMNAGAQAAKPDTQEQLIGVHDAFVPPNFAHGDEAYVVVSGLFPNSCYSYSRSVVTNLSSNLREVQVYANVRQGLCLMVLLPFHQSVPLGELAAGDQTIRLVNGDGTYMEVRFTVK